MISQEHNHAWSYTLKITITYINHIFWCQLCMEQRWLHIYLYIQHLYEWKPNLLVLQKITKYYSLINWSWITSYSFLYLWNMLISHSIAITLHNNLKSSSSTMWQSRATYVCANQVFHSKIKHIKLNYHFVWDNVGGGSHIVSCVHPQLAHWPPNIIITQKSTSNYFDLRLASSIEVTSCRGILRKVIKQSQIYILYYSII